MREFLWRLPRWANHRFEQIIEDMGELDESDEAYWVCVEDMRSLPGFPANSADYSLIRREITTIGDVY